MGQTKTTKATQKRVDAALVTFNARYAGAGQWGERRWYDSLYPALTQPTAYVAVINLYAANSNEGRNVLGQLEGTSLNEVELPISLSTGLQNESASVEEKVICYERRAQSMSKNDSQLLPTEPVTTVPFPAPERASVSSDSLLTHWNLDAASVLAAHMLDAQPGDRVLDMCAAPGGKTIVLAQKLFPHLYRTLPNDLSIKQDTLTSSLVVNELDTSRYKRLDTNVRAYLPSCLFPTPETPQAPIKILNRDMSAKESVSMLPHGREGYDRVLIDAPCSSERHIIHAYEKARMSGQIAEEMLNWKTTHVTTLVKTQMGLLRTAFKAVKIGGRVVYATCALGCEENDGVIDKVLENLASERKKAKRDGMPLDEWDIEFQLGTESSQLDTEDPVLQRMTEPTKYGRIALPDHGGWGPLYFSVMTKVNRTRKTKSKKASGATTTVLS